MSDTPQSVPLLSDEREIRERFEAHWKAEYGHIPTWSENMQYLATPGAQQAFTYFKKGLLVRRESERRHSRHEALYTLAVGYEKARQSRYEWLHTPDTWPSPTCDEEAPSPEWATEYDKRSKEVHRLEGLYKSALNMAIEIESTLSPTDGGPQ